MSGKGKDAAVLSFGFAYEQATHHIKAPEYLSTAENNDKISSAMRRKSN